MKRPSDHVSLNIFDQIDSICREYRALWKQGKRPRLEPWIDQVPEDAQPQLFLNLLQTEIAFRLRAKETPASDDYLKRFPHFSRQVRQAFHEQSLMSMDEQRGAPNDFGDAGDTTYTMATPTARRLGDYELLRELGRGGMGVVYEARHFKTQNRVALKTLPSGMDGQDVNADRLHRFRREFRSLSEINHPNLVGMQTLEVDGTQWFFTMDLIEGIDYLDYVRPSGQRDEERLRSSLAQLIRGIMALHQRRIVHRDIKPSNFMVERDGTVKILDFGLVAELQQVTDFTQTRSTNFAGTPKYAAPEQMFGQRSEASDWYAVGVMLFEALNGQAPFVARDPMELLRQKQTADPPAMVGRTDLPVDLAALADGLLKREPKERWTIATILEHLGLDSDTRMGGSSATAGSTDSHGSSVSGSDDLERAMLSDEEDIVLIGRERQLAQLEEARQDLLRTRKPVVVWVSGLSGEGKSSLVEKFLRPLRKGDEMLVLSGRCYDRESVPFKAVDCLIEAMVAYIKSVHGNWLQRQPPEDIEFLAQVFPLLRRIDWIAAREIHNLSRIEPDQIRGRAFHSLRQLLRMIGQRNPVVVLIDDLQWGDSDSAKVWHELLAQDNPPVTLFLGSFRRDEADESPFLVTWNNLNNAGYQHIESRDVKVEPLSRADCIALAAARTSIDASIIEQQIADLLQESGGNPYFLDQLLDGFDSASGSFKHIPLDQIIAGRLSRLPSSAARLLEAIAVSGHPIRMEEAARVADVTDHYLATITHMRSERLVRLMGDMQDLKVETYHDEIRETVLSSLASDRRKNLHLRMAETIELFEQLSASELLAELQRLPIPGEYQKPVSHRVVDLANHYFEAGDSRAFVYQLLAAEQSMLSYAVEEAAAYYDRIPLLLPPNQPATMTFRVWMGAGRVYKWNKESDKAIHAFQTAIANGSTSIQIAQAHEGLSKVYLQLSRIDEGILESKRALEYLHVRMPESSFGCLLSFLLESFSLLVVPSRWLQAKSSARQEIHRETFKVLALGGGEAALLEKNMLTYIDGLMKSALAAVKTGDPKYKAIGFAIAAYLLSGIGVRWLGNVLLRRSLSIRSGLEDPELRGSQLAYSGMSNFLAGDLETAKSELTEAVPILQRCHFRYLLHMCLHVNRHAAAYVGSSLDELQLARETFHHASVSKNPQEICWGSYDTASALSRSGQLPEAAVFMQRANTILSGDRFFMTESVRAATDSYVRLQFSDYKNARRLAEISWQLIMKTWCACDYTLFCLPTYIESIIGPNWLKPLSQHDRRHARRMLRVAFLLYPAIPNHQSHVKRVHGRACAAMGHPRKAIRNFEAAIRLAEKKKMNYQQARSLLDLAAIKEQDRNENRSQAIQILKEMKSVIPRAESWLLGDQYDESVVAPEFDIATWEREHGLITPQLGEGHHA